MAVFTMQLERAAEAYQWGRHEECLQLLQQGAFLYAIQLSH